MGLFKGHTRAFRTNKQQIVPDSVATLERVTLGGVPQWLLVRGRSRDNPLLLCLHGGPGHSESAHFRRFNHALESSFLVAYWDQRGSSASWSARQPPEALTLDQLFSDASELIDLLRRTYGQSTVGLLAHSFGTILGMRLATQLPNQISFYVGASQVVQALASERLGYAQVLALARTRGMGRAVRELEEIGPPPYNGIGLVEGRAVQRAWQSKLNQIACHSSLLGLTARSLVGFEEYSLREKLGALRGLDSSVRALWPTMLDFDILTSSLRLRMPSFFVTGAQDGITPPHLMREFIERLEAPMKLLVEFEASAHLCLWEEPERFNTFMLQKVLPAARPRHRFHLIDGEASA